MTLLLAGCAVSRPVAVQTTVLNLQTASSIRLPATEVTENSLRPQWRAALQKAFGRRSIAIDPAAPFVVDFALSIREAETGVAEVEQPAKDVAWRSEPRKSRFLDKCTAHRLRGTLVVFRTTDGAIIYRGESEADDCTFDTAAIDAMAEQLVSSAVGR